jgi:hypothetical protein
MDEQLGGGGDSDLSVVFIFTRTQGPAEHERDWTWNFVARTWPHDVFKEDQDQRPDRRKR